MAIRVVRLGSPREKGEGLRIGTVRRPPRGVRKKDFARKDFYDVWLPELSPSDELLAFARGGLTPARWKQFARRYRKEMSGATPQRLLALLAALSKGTNFSVGCYCEDETRCHRSLLRELLEERGGIEEKARRSASKRLAAAYDILAGDPSESGVATRGRATRTRSFSR